MLEVEQGKRMLRIAVDGRLVLIHSVASPFITANTHALTDYSYDEKRGVVRFSAGRRFIDFRAEERDGALSLTFITSYKAFERVTLRFLARVREPVFGGGTQQSPNLKGRKISLCAGGSGGYGTHTDAEVVRRVLRRGEEFCAMPVLFFHDGSRHWFHVKFGGRARASFAAGDHHELTLYGIPDEILMGVGEDDRDVMQHAPRRVMDIPPWSYEGIIVGASGGATEMLRRLDRFIAAGTHVGAVYLRDWSGSRNGATSGVPFLDLRWSGELYPRLPEILDMLKSRGVRAIARVTPLCSADSLLFAEASREGCLLRGGDGRIAMCEVDGTPVGQLDLTGKAARELCVKVLREHVLGSGFSGLQPEIYGCTPPEAMHNRWAELWRDVCIEALDNAGDSRGFVFDAPADGSGAAFASDGGAGLKSALGDLLSLSQSGVVNAHSDFGAHFESISTYERMEVASRFYEMAAFMPFFRIPAQSGKIFDDDTFMYVVRCAKLHSGLARYIAALFDECRSSGLAPVRYIDDGGRCEQFMLGGDVVVAPALSLGQDEVRVSLPQGEWTRFFSGDRYCGDTTITVGAPIGAPAAFYRNGCEWEQLFAELRL